MGILKPITTAFDAHDLEGILAHFAAAVRHDDRRTAHRSPRL